MTGLTLNALPMTSEAPRGSIFARAYARYVGYMTFRATVAQLNALSERNLADVGLVRAGIPDRARSVARKASTEVLNHARHA